MSVLTASAGPACLQDKALKESDEFISTMAVLLQPYCCSTSHIVRPFAYVVVAVRLLQSGRELEHVVSDKVKMPSGRPWMRELRGYLVSL